MRKVGTYKEMFEPVRPRESAVLLLAHGSHLSAGTAEPVREMAGALRRRRAVGEVRVAFWKEDPHLHHALQTVEARFVFAVPIFTSTGYFTDTVVPRELGISGGASPVEGMQVRLLDPIGTHPRMADLVLDRAHDARPHPGGNREEEPLHLVVVGHGTPRHPNSGRVTRKIAEELRGRWPWGTTRSAFLDQEPRVLDVLRELRPDRAVLVPFFISKGWHAGVTLPQDLGGENPASISKGGALTYAAPVGTHPDMVDVVEEMVLHEMGRSPFPKATTPFPPTPAQAARKAFLAWVDRAGAEGRTFLQMRLRRTEMGTYEVRHASDADVPAERLKVRTDPEAAWKITAVTEEGRPRPLKTAPNLRRGWIFRDLSADDLWEACSHLAPAAAVHWHLARTGRLPTVSFRDAARRQTGMFQGLSDLPDEEVSELVNVQCRSDKCLRKVAWWRTAAEAGDEDPVIPCPEPCSILFTKLLERR